jgi:large subunit ribosomal protein L9
MEVLLLEKIHRLGDLGDRVKVKAGFGRNYLIPSRKAVPATPENLAAFEARRAEFEQAQAEALASAQARAVGLDGLTVTVTARSGAEGKLFGSVGTVDICEALAAAGHVIEKREVRLPAGPLREVGDHAVHLHLHADVNVTVTVHIEADQETPPVE